MRRGAWLQAVQLIFIDNIIFCKVFLLFLKKKCRTYQKFNLALLSDYFYEQ